MPYNPILTIILLALFCIAINIPLGRWRGQHQKFSAMWFVLVHASVPLIIALRIYLKTPTVFIPLFIVAAVLGQFIGGRTNAKETNTPTMP